HRNPHRTRKALTHSRSPNRDHRHQPPWTEQLDASGILAVVAAAFAVATSANYPSTGRRKPLPYQTRLKEHQVWPLVDTLLSVFVFAYLGLQLRFLLQDLNDSGASLPRTLFASLVLLTAVIVVRATWVFLIFGRWHIERRLEDAFYQQRPHTRWKPTRHRAAGQGPHLRPLDPPNRAETLIVGWCGMRGIITLAAAASVPATTRTGAPFPGRSIIQIAAFTIAFGTLLIQGTTLPALARHLATDQADEQAAQDGQLDEAHAIAAQHPHDYDAERAALARAVAEGQVDDEAARTVIHQLDLQQAATRRDASS
ncbi:cation:proton antiporter, partial [Streptomyces sp. NPDC101455]|uniref:cation:proton antiporter domain-containing protein n=1 Tax=Streptomyces sp. NPDC101455 TaxID=3366142 RepID=UPI0037FDE5EB